MIKHHSYKIQNVIQKELFAAKHSIKICVAWFTNDLLFQPLLLKLDAGVEVAIITNKDEINFGENNDVDFDEFIQRGGCIFWNERSDKSRLLHHKFCIIDDSVVISGSYNWTNGAEYNDEDITVYSEEPETTKHYSDIFDKLAAQLPMINNINRCKLGQSVSEELCAYQLAIVYKTINDDRVYGVVNTNNEIVIPFKFISIKWRDNHYIEAHTNSGDICVYDASGNQIEKDRIITYTSIDDSILKLNPSRFDEKIISNTYFNGLGVIIFDNVIYRIQSLAFSYCSTIASITLPESITSIWMRAFEGCENLRDVNIFNNVSSIGIYAFRYCKSLVNVSLPDNITSINEGTFSGCNSLKIVRLPNNITSIGNDAFKGCDIEDIYIPSTIQSIGIHAFARCQNLTKFIGEYATSDGKCLIINNELICFAYSGLSGYSIPSTVKSIGEEVFSQCDNLISIVIPEGVQYIGSGAFKGCSGLDSIMIPNSVTHIGNAAFYGCSNLESVSIPNSVIHIGESAFNSCSNLRSIIIGNGLTYISSRAFEACNKLTDIILPDGMERIMDWAFAGCESLSRVTIPESILSIYNCAFEDTLFHDSNLREVYCKPLIPPKADVFMSNGWHAFPYILYESPTIYVPITCVDDYKNADGWKEYADHIVGYDFENEKEL